MWAAVGVGSIYFPLAMRHLHSLKNCTRILKNCTHLRRNAQLQAAALSGLYTCGGGEALLDPEPGKDKLSRRMATAACCAAGRLRGKYCIIL